MGFKQTIIKKVPDEKNAVDFMNEVYDRAKAQMDEDSGSSHDGCEVRLLKIEEFDEEFENQENIKNTDEIKDKYRKLTGEGRVIIVEMGMDW